MQTPLLLLLVLTTSIATASAQTRLTLAEAMARARAAHPSARAAGAAAREAAERERQARAGLLPRLDVSESWQRGNQPVFVFSSLLSQRRFAAENFAIEALNRPDALSHTTTSLRVEQLVFDGGATRLAVQGARLARDEAALTGEAVGDDLALGAARAFARVLALEADGQARRAAVEAAEADRARAGRRRDAGLATDADVLALDVRLADMRQRLSSVEAESLVARLALNEAMGADLDESFALDWPVLPPAATDPAGLEHEALERRPEAQRAALTVERAGLARRAAGSAWWPRVQVQGGLDYHGRSVASQVSSWLVGAEVRFNVFGGFADVARAAEAREAETRHQADREQTERAIRVEVRTALARLESARARETLGRLAVSQARESQRIVRDRYENGLAGLADLLRAAEAVLEAESLSTAARLDLALQVIQLDRAVGRL
jgi:outer membrane protein TolC